ncbi:MAG TPA: SurA N-terminal domain-containing protein [bacterium]|nr:SurA N-terminal domain-containing protein [bacterium]
MLNTFRTKIKFWSHIFLWPVIISFIAFYGWSFLDRPQETNAAAIVGDTEISWRNVVETRRQLHRYYRQVYGENFERFAETMDFNEMALEQLVNRALLNQLATDLGVTVSEPELQSHIAAIPAFQKDGAFSTSTYQRMLARMGMSPAQYEASVRDDVRLEKTRSLLSAAAPITEDELKERYTQQNVTVNCDYLVFKMPDFKSKVEESPEAIEAYYNAHTEDFRVGDQVLVKYIAFDPKKFEKDVEIFDEDIEDYYDRNFDQYQIPEKIRASHILIKVDADADEAAVEAARQKAQVALDRIKAGEDFAEVAKEVSEGPTGPNGGDLGFFEQGRMDPSFEKAAFELEEGQITQEPVRSRFGWHIIKKTGHQESSWKSLEDVRQEIEKAIREEESKVLVMSKAQDLFDNVEPGVTKIEDLVGDGSRLDVETSEFFEPSTPPRNIGFARNLEDILTNLSEGEISIPVETIRGVYIFQLTATKESFIPPFEDVKEDALTKFRNDTASELAQAEAEKARQQLLDGTSMEDVAAQFGVQSANTGDFTQGMSVPGVGGNEEIVNDLFALSVGDVSPVYDIRKNGVVFKIISRKDFDEAAFRKAIPKLRQQMLRTRESDILSSWLEQTKTKLGHEGKYMINSVAEIE